MRKIIDSIIGHTLIALVAVMVINVLWQVASRYLLKAPSGFTDELAGFLLMWVGLLGAAYATGQRLHLAIDLLPRKMSEAGQKRNNILVNGLIMLFALLVMVVGGGRLVYLTLSLNQLSSALQVPLGYVYAVIPLSGLLTIYYSWHNLAYNPYR